MNANITYYTYPKFPIEVSICRGIKRLFREESCYVETLWAQFCVPMERTRLGGEIPKVLVAGHNPKLLQGLRL